MAVNPLSRREVLKFGAYTTVGGVLTPGISLAQAVVTDTKGITARDEQIESGGTKIPIYHAGPEKMAKYPVIVVISGFTGNSEQNKDVCRRFAHAGYYAIAPELYSREGGMQGKDFQQMGAISSKVTRAQYLGDIKAAADYARQQRWARAERIGVTGFCGGGALTLHFTSEYPDVAAAVPWYGHVKRTYSDAPGVDAFAVADKIKVPVLGSTARPTPGSRSPTSRPSSRRFGRRATPASSSCCTRARRTRSSPTIGRRRIARTRRKTRGSAASRSSINT